MSYSILVFKSTAFRPKDTGTAIHHRAMATPAVGEASRREGIAKLFGLLTIRWSLVSNT